MKRCCHPSINPTYFNEAAFQYRFLFELDIIEQSILRGNEVDSVIVTINFGLKEHTDQLETFHKVFIFEEKRMKWTRHAWTYLIEGEDVVVDTIVRQIGILDAPIGDRLCGLLLFFGGQFLKFQRRE